METKDLLKKVRKIEIKTKGLSRHIFSGEYHSAFKGRGMSFAEVREYQYGDDIRTIDWNVTARFNTPFVKIFEEERELTVMLIVDVSASNSFGSQNFKDDIKTEIAAIISFSAINNNDKVGVIFFSDKIEKFIPPQKGKTHILRIIRELINFNPQNSGTNISEALRYFNGVTKKRTIAFIMSDFRDQNYHKDLKIASKRHDIVGINIYDNIEKNLPNLGLIRVYDAENFKTIWIDSSSKKTRNKYKNEFDKLQKQTKNYFLGSNADLININTSSSYVKDLLNFFRNR